MYGFWIARGRFDGLVWSNDVFVFVLRGWPPTYISEASCSVQRKLQRILSLYSMGKRMLLSC